MKRKNVWAWATVMTVFLMVGCHDHEDHDDHEELDEDACEHLVGGPFNMVTASTEASTAPVIGTPHTSHVVSLVPVAGGNGGLVSYPAPEAGDYVVFLDRAVPVTFTQGGATVTPEAVAQSSQACADIKARYTVELAEGMVTLSFGPSSETQVSILIAEQDHDH